MPTADHFSIKPLLDFLSSRVDEALSAVENYFKDTSEAFLSLEQRSRRASQNDFLRWSEHDEPVLASSNPLSASSRPWSRLGKVVLLWLLAASQWQRARAQHVLEGYPITPAYPYLERVFYINLLPFDFPLEKPAHSAYAKQMLDKLDLMEAFLHRRYWGELVDDTLLMQLQEQKPLYLLLSDAPNHDNKLDTKITSALYHILTKNADIKKLLALKKYADKPLVFLGSFLKNFIELGYYKQAADLVREVVKLNPEKEIRIMTAYLTNLLVRVKRLPNFNQMALDLEPVDALLDKILLPDEHETWDQKSEWLGATVPTFFSATQDMIIYRALLLFAGNHPYENILEKLLEMKKRYWLIQVGPIEGLILFTGFLLNAWRLEELKDAMANLVANIVKNTQYHPLSLEALHIAIREVELNIGALRQFNLHRGHTYAEIAQPLNRFMIQFFLQAHVLQFVTLNQQATSVRQAKLLENYQHFIDLWEHSRATIDLDYDNKEFYIFLLSLTLKYLKKVKSQQEAEDFFVIAMARGGFDQYSDIFDKVMELWAKKFSQTLTKFEFYRRYYALKAETLLLEALGYEQHQDLVSFLREKSTTRATPKWLNITAATLVAGLVVGIITVLMMKPRNNANRAQTPLKEARFTSPRSKKKLRHPAVFEDYSRAVTASAVEVSSASYRSAVEIGPSARTTLVDIKQIAPVSKIPLLADEDEFITKTPVGEKIAEIAFYNMFQSDVTFLMEYVNLMLETEEEDNKKEIDYAQTLDFVTHFHFDKKNFKNKESLKFFIASQLHEYVVTQTAPIPLAVEDKKPQKSKHKESPPAKRSIKQQPISDARDVFDKIWAKKREKIQHALACFKKHENDVFEREVMRLNLVSAIIGAYEFLVTRQRDELYFANRDKIIPSLAEMRSFAVIRTGLRHFAYESGLSEAQFDSQLINAAKMIIESSYILLNDRDLTEKTLYTVYEEAYNKTHPTTKVSFSATPLYTQARQLRRKYREEQAKDQQVDTKMRAGLADCKEWIDQFISYLKAPKALDTHYVRSALAIKLGLLAECLDYFKVDKMSYIWIQHISSSTAHNNNGNLTIEKFDMACLEYEKLANFLAATIDFQKKDFAY